MKLHGSVAVITGAAQGIGKSLAWKMAESGAKVWALDKDATTLASLKNETSKLGLSLETIPVDVSDTAGLKAACKTVMDHGGKITHWVNNAGISGIGDFMDLTPEAIEKIVQVNLSAVLVGTRLAIAAMETKGIGTIINMASVAGHIHAPYLSSYCATKFGVVGFTRALREEMKLKASPLKFVLVSPGFVETAMIRKGATLGFPERLGWMLSTPDSVAYEILQGLAKNRVEIFPTLNGRVMLKLQKFVPGASSRGSKLLLGISSRG